MGRYPTYVEMANAIRAAIAGAGGLPAGGTTGDVLTKASATDYDTTWSAAPAAANGLPTGGTTGQLLVKNTATNYDASFSTVGTVPVGGTLFQSLVKASATDYDVTWGSPAAANGLPTGGTSLQLLVKSGAADYSTTWADFSSYAATILRTVKDTTVRTSTSNTTLTATGLTFTVTSGQMYHLKAFGTFRTAATTTGLALGFSTTVATTYAGWGVQIEQAAAGTDQNYTATATSLASTLVSTGVVAANTDYQWEIEGRFQPSASGTVTIGFRSEVSGSTATWQAGAGAILTNIG